MPKKLSSAKTTERALRKQREEDYAVTGDRNAAVFGNLRTTLHGAQGRLTADNARLLDRMSQMQGRMKLAERRTGAVEQDLVQRYGGMFGATAHNEMQGARIFSQTGHQHAIAQSQAQQAVAGAGQDIMAGMQAGAREAEAAAGYASAQALAARTKEDVTLVAQMRHDIEMAKLEAELDTKKQKDILEFQFKLERGQLGDDAPDYQNIADTFSQIYVQAGQFLRSMQGQTDPNTGEPTVTTAQDVLAHLVDQGVLTEDEALSNTAVRRLVGTLVTGGPGTAGTRVTDMVLESIESAYPDFTADRKMAEKSVLARLRAHYGSSFDAGEGGAASPDARVEGAKAGRRMTGAAAGAAIGGAFGSVIPGPGTLIGAGVGAVVGSLTAQLTGNFDAAKPIIDEIKKLEDAVEEGRMSKAAARKKVRPLIKKLQELT